MFVLYYFNYYYYTMEMQSIIMCRNYTFNLNCMVFNEVLNAFLYDIIDKTALQYLGNNLMCQNLI